MNLISYFVNILLANKVEQPSVLCIQIIISLNSQQRHKHSDKLEQRIKAHLTESMALPNENDENSWELFAEEGELKVRYFFF